MMSMCISRELIYIANISPRFGNFIGEAEESEEEESQHGGNGYRAYDLDDEEEEESPANKQQLVELDGSDFLFCRPYEVY